MILDVGVGQAILWVVAHFGGIFALGVLCMGLFRAVWKRIQGEIQRANESVVSSVNGVKDAVNRVSDNLTSTNNSLSDTNALAQQNRAIIIDMQREQATMRA